jgi:hypothetical protein
MKKQRKGPTIVKPVIDEEAAVRFASAGSGQAPEPSTARLPKAASKQPAAAKKVPHDDIEKNMRLISLTIDKDLYDRIAKEAAHKNRTVEEHLRKHLIKRYEK